MRLTSFIRKGLRLKAHRVSRIQEEAEVLVAEIDWIPGRRTGRLQEDSLALAEESLEPQSEGADTAVRALPEESTHRPCLLPQGSLPAILGLQEGGVVVPLPHPLALVGISQPTRTVQGFRPDDSGAHRWHPVLDEPPCLER